MILPDKLGYPPSSLAVETEPLFIKVESDLGSGNFQALPISLLNASIHRQANSPTTAEIEIGLAPQPGFQGHNSTGDSRDLRDWQLPGMGGLVVNPWDALLGGRRVQLRTLHQQPQDDWLLFEGYLSGKLQLGWSGASSKKVRWLRAFATSSIVAADREISQLMYGQWRRSYRGEKNSLNAVSDYSLECVPDYAAPCIFNPGGRGNCNATALDYGDEPAGLRKPVYVFCDPDDDYAIPWNVARMLRYIQWAALQPGLSAPPAAKLYDARYTYDVPRYSSTSVAAGRWTSIGLSHTMNYQSASNRSDVGPNLDALVAAYIDAIDSSGSDARSRTLLRQLGDIAIDRMTVLEAFALLCDRAGLAFWDEHDTDKGGVTHTYLRFAVQGDRNPSPGVPDSGGSQPYGQGGSDEGGGGGGGGQPTTPSSAFSARGVYLYVASDRVTDFTKDTDGTLTATRKDVATLYKESGPFEGNLTFSEDHLRRTLVVAGNPVQYEVTCGPLLPGWVPDGAWDVDPANTAAVDAAIAGSYSPSFASRYQLKSTTAYKYLNTGRYWVLGEDGHYWSNRKLYQGTAGTGPARSGSNAWASDDAWAPFQWRNGNTLSSGSGSSPPNITELVNRAGAYWPLRRRKFLPLIAEFNGRQLDPIIEVQFIASGPWYQANALGLSAQFDSSRCAIYFTTSDLAKIVDPADPTRSYITQHIRNLLRVRVTANIEGSDALTAWALPDQSDGAAINWAALISRSGKLPRILRYDPNTGGAPVANSQLILDLNAKANVTTKNRDSQTEAVSLAKDIRDAAALIRVNGSVTIPWLWRNNYGPVPGYNIADEIIGIHTQDDETFVDFQIGRPATAPCPRIVGIRYTYAESGEQSTTLIIGDEALSPRPSMVPTKRTPAIERRM